MSKLEEKLSASIKAGGASRAESPAAKPAPARSSTPSKTKAAKSKPAASKKSTGAADLNAPVQELHPTRIWPD